MLKSCQYCGRVHDSKFDCGMKPVRNYKRESRTDRFRYTSAWQQKREQIKQRDHYLCQICLRNMYGTKKRLNSDNISVHHIEKLEENYEKRLDDYNLISLCEMHHKMADRNDIPKSVLSSIVYDMIGPPEGVSPIY